MNYIAVWLKRCYLQTYLIQLRMVNYTWSLSQIMVPFIAMILFLWTKGNDISSRPYMDHSTRAHQRTVHVDNGVQGGIKENVKYFNLY